LNNPGYGNHHNITFLSPLPSTRPRKHNSLGLSLNLNSSLSLSLSWLNFGFTFTLAVSRSKSSIYGLKACRATAGQLRRECLKPRHQLQYVAYMAEAEALFMSNSTVEA
jgi:hypothetical protein